MVIAFQPQFLPKLTQYIILGLLGQMFFFSYADHQFFSDPTQIF